MVEVRKRERPSAPIAAPASGKAVVSEVEATLKQITKTHGENTATIGMPSHTGQHLPFGIFSLDIALMGGLPEGYATLIYGWESSGKTLLATKAIQSAQRKYPSKYAVLIDLENTFDERWARAHGVDVDDKFIYSLPRSGEQALDVADGFIRSQEVSLVVVDSLPALIPIKEVERSLEDQSVGEQARMIGRFLRKVQQAFIDESLRGHSPTIILINQWRYKVGVMHGDPRTLPGGTSQNYVASTKIEMKNKERMGKDENDFDLVDYNEHSFTIHKNKLSNSIRSGEFVMIRDPTHPLGEGFIDDASTVVSWAKKSGLVLGGGGAYRLDGLEGETFRKLEDIAAYMYQDLDFFERFKMRLISMHRARYGHAASGWYTPEEGVDNLGVEEE